MLTDERIKELWANGFTITVMAGPFVEHFARAVEREARAQERERCARIVDEHRGPIEIYNKCYPALMACADAIRALGEKP